MTNQDKLLNEIRGLSISERMLIVESIWDSIVSSQEGLSVTEEQKEDLEKRYNDFKEDPADGSAWSEVKSRIQSKK